MKKILLSLLILAAVSTAVYAQEVNLYGSAEVRTIEYLAQQYEKDTGIKVNWIRMSSGETLARLRAEKSAPKGDVWWGGTTDPHSIAAKEGLTENYTPSNYDEIDKRFRDPLGDGSVIGVYVGGLGFSVNEKLLKKLKIPVPTGWEDLLNPKLKGLVAVANPNTSGTALTTLCTQVFRLGEDKGLEYMKKLHKNIANYTKSGSAPGILAGRGEVAVAIIFLHDSVYHAEQGYPVKPVAPKEGTGYEIGAVNLIKGAPNSAEAKKFIDWVLSAKTQEGLGTVGSYQIPTNTNAKVPDVAIPLSEFNIVDYDFGWVAENGVRLQDRWTREVFTIRR